MEEEEEAGEERQLLGPGGLQPLGQTADQEKDEERIQQVQQQLGQPEGPHPPAPCAMVERIGGEDHRAVGPVHVPLAVHLERAEKGGDVAHLADPLFSFTAAMSSKTNGPRKMLA